MTEYNPPSATTTQEMYDVLICGAGSVGMYLAYQMCHMGHSVYFCDQRPSYEGQKSEATLMTSRTLDILESQGIVHRFMDGSVPSQGIQFHLHEKSFASIDTIGDMPFPQMRLLMQSQTSDIFHTLLKEQNCVIHWGLTLTGYTQLEDHVEATLQNQNATTTKIRARYIIGADGKRPTSVRRLADIEWICRWYKVPVPYIVADVILEGEDYDKLLTQHIHVFAVKTGLCVIIPFKKAKINADGSGTKKLVYRLILDLDTHFQTIDDTFPIRRLPKCTDRIENIQELIPLSKLQYILDERIKPLKLNVSEVLEMVVYDVHDNKADGFRHKRAFLVGASAYSSSLTSVQAVCTGFQDVENLAWKLSLVLKGLSPNPEELLNSYSTERELGTGASLQIIKYLAKLNRCRYKSVLGFLAYCFSMILLSSNSIKTLFVKVLLQLNVSLPTASLALCKAIPGPIDAGTYIFDTCLLSNRILKHDGTALERKTLRQIINHSVTTNPSDGHHYTAHYTILWISTRPSNVEKCPWTSEFWVRFTAEHCLNGAIRAIVFESTWHVEDFMRPEFATEGFYSNEEAFWMEDCWDRFDSITARAGLLSHMHGNPSPPAVMVLVRPDLYVIFSHWIHSPLDIDTAFGQLSEFVNPIKTAEPM